MVKLVELTMANFDECVNLQVDDSQKGFVASNSYSISEAFADKVSEPHAIYANDVMVGFIMYDYDPGKETGFISRLMIDKRYQKNGYACEAMQMVIEMFKNIQECKYIQLSYNSKNDRAARFYEKLGFIKTGEISNGEIVCKITL